jgi:hypothetical protein
MKRWLTVILIVTATLGCASMAFAAWPTNFEGKPRLLLQEQDAAYFLWHDADGVHIRAITDGDQHVFNGSIATNGKLENIMTKTAAERDYARLSNSGGRLNFRLTAAANPAGIDLFVVGGSKVKFSLEIDGRKISPSQIFVGAEGWSPGDSIFTISYRKDLDLDDDCHSHTTIILGPDWFWWPFGPPHGPRGPRHP